jgi:hypothetical protein
MRATGEYEKQKKNNKKKKKKKLYSSWPPDNTKSQLYVAPSLPFSDGHTPFFISMTFAKPFLCRRKPQCSATT